jgi:two-component system, OmpR family, sensor kinase
LVGSGFRRRENRLLHVTVGTPPTLGARSAARAIARVVARFVRPACLIRRFRPWAGRRLDGEGGGLEMGRGMDEATGSGVTPTAWQGLVGSMRIRIVAAVVLLLAVSAAVSILLLRGVLRERLDEEIADNLQREVAEFDLLLTRGINPTTGEPFGSDVESVFDLYFAREVPDNHETLLAFAGDRLHDFVSDQEAVPPDRLGDAIAYWLGLEEREEGVRTFSAGETRYVALPFGEGDGQGLFVAANFPAVEQREIDAAVRTHALTQLVTIILASLVGLGLAGRVLRPLRSLTETAETITATDLTRRIPVHGEGEASRIAMAFNDMLERLEAAFATQRQFLDDASHELRVPLTVVRGNVEVLELVDDPEERASMILLVTNEIERMSRIVEDLLLLARAERPGFLAKAAVDVGELTEDIHRKATTLGQREWELGATADVTVQADGQRLTQAMMQLAQNACQHTGEGDAVRIGSAVEDGHVVLWVHDSGPGVAPADRQRVFDRYVKGSGRPAGSGLGLGLSIVAAIATAHGGTARLADGVAGARFEILIPSDTE